MWLEWWEFPPVLAKWEKGGNSHLIPLHFPPGTAGTCGTGLFNAEHAEWSGKDGNGI
jgi:hypothetical protein